MFAGAEVVSTRLRECAVGICWSQWQALTSMRLASGLASGLASSRSIVDPEALILLTLSVRGLERRVEEPLRWWAEEGSTLLSVQRTRSLLALHPSSARDAIATFAALASEAGDKRWRTLASGGSAPSIGRPGKNPRELRLLDPSTLMLRLRAGFGVGVKADVLTFLIGNSSRIGDGGAWATAANIAEGISYSVASVRRAMADMCLARLVESSDHRPARYSVRVDDWASLLRLDDPGSTSGVEGGGDRALPPWRSWAQMFAFLTSSLEFSEWLRDSEAPAVVGASRARDITERHRWVLIRNGVDPVDPRLFPGERYLEAFARTVARVCDWIERER